MMEFIQAVLVALLSVGFSLCDAWGNLRPFQSPRSLSQKPAPLRSVSWNPSPLSFPLGSDSRRFAQDPLGVQSKQMLEGPVKPLDWRFPVVPDIHTEVAVGFEQRPPVTPSSVAVQCSESSVLVEVQQDLFSNGQLIQPSGLLLGGCPAVGEDSHSKVLIFQYQLQDCGSVLMVSSERT